MSYWPHGAQNDLAELIGCTPQRINDILHRRVGVSKEMALQLEEASRSVLGGAGVPWQEWLFNETTRHDAFYGEGGVE